MTYILFGLGVLFILLGFVDVFPKIKQNYLDLEEMQRWQKQKKEVIQAKEDLDFLLEELKNVSEQAVKSIETKINEAKTVNLFDKPNVTNQIEENNLTVPQKNIAKSNKDIKLKENKDKINKETKSGNDKNKQKDILEASKIKTSNLNISENNNSIDKHTYIYQLSKQGISVDEIAQKVQMGKGEVELIIGIKRRGEQA